MDQWSGTSPKSSLCTFSTHFHHFLLLFHPFLPTKALPVPHRWGLIESINYHSLQPWERKKEKRCRKCRKKSSFRKESTSLLFSFALCFFHSLTCSLFFSSFLFLSLLLFPMSNTAVLSIGSRGRIILHVGVFGLVLKQCCCSLSLSHFSIFLFPFLPSPPPTTKNATTTPLPRQLERVHDERAGSPDLEGVEQPQPQAPGRPGARVDQRRSDLVPGDAERGSDDVVDGQGPKGERDRVGRVEPDAERDDRPDGAADGLAGEVEIDAARDGEDGGGEPGAGRRRERRRRRRRRWRWSNGRIQSVCCSSRRRRDERASSPRRAGPGRGKAVCVCVCVRERDDGEEKEDGERRRGRGR